MADQTAIPFTDELLETNCICCVICKDLLRPPIMLVESVGNVCSVCFMEEKKSKNLKSLNNSALEIVIAILKLPCKFKTKGCKVRLGYEELILHQNNCKYRTKLCSLFKLSGCNWEGSASDFVNHFKEMHGDHVINFENNLFYLQTSLNDLDLVKLLVMRNHTYILHMQTDLCKKKLFYLICNVRDDSDVFYEYSVKHKGSSHNYIKTKSRILPASNIYNDYIDESVAVEVDLESLKQIAQVADTITNIFKIKVDTAQPDGIDEKMLHFFECPVCKNFMKPPIYQCQSGHSICNICRPRLEKCPTCRSMFGTTRNYSLEGLTSGIQYPCIYHDLGCSEMSMVNKIIKHESECPFKPYNCPFPNCTSSGNQQMIVAHLRDFHSEGVILSGTPGYTESFRLDQNTYYNKVFERKCVVAYNHIFRLACKRVAEHCLWAAEVIGSNGQLNTFVYEVAIVDMRRPEKKLIRTDYCLNEMSEDELFKRCIMFPNSILSSYSNHGMVTFHFTIKEK